jgi:hypothetical protein
MLTSLLGKDEIAEILFSLQFNSVSVEGKFARLFSSFLEHSNNFNNSGNAGSSANLF